MSLLSPGKSRAKVGFLVVDCQRRMIGFNPKFIDLWSIPKHLFVSRDDDHALEFVSQQFKEPESFLFEVREIYRHPDLVIYDTIRLKDGKILERYSQPQLLEDKIVGRIWKFRQLV